MPMKTLLSHLAAHARPILKLLPLLFVTAFGLAVAPVEAQTQSEAPTVIIDPGHGGKDPGAVRIGVMEKSLNLKLALAVEHYLHDHGINTAITRDRDSTLSLPKRAEYAAHFKNPVFVSLHYNAALRPSAHGVETFYHSSKSQALAMLIQNALIQGTGAEDRGVRNRGFHVLKNNKAPVAVLVEGGFISNLHERLKVSHPGYRDTQAQAIASAIATFLGRPAPSRRAQPGLMVQQRSSQNAPAKQLVLAALPATTKPTTRSPWSRAGQSVRRLDPRKLLRR